MYNSGTWGISKKEENSSLYRFFSQATATENIKCKIPSPHIGNAQVYLQTGEEPLSLQIINLHSKRYKTFSRYNWKTIQFLLI